MLLGSSHLPDNKRQLLDSSGSSAKQPSLNQRLPSTASFSACAGHDQLHYLVGAQHVSSPPNAGARDDIINRISPTAEKIASTGQHQFEAQATHRRHSDLFRSPRPEEQISPDRETTASRSSIGTIAGPPGSSVSQQITHCKSTFYQSCGVNF